MLDYIRTEKEKQSTLRNQHGWKLKNTISPAQKSIEINFNRDKQRMLMSFK